jgi:hypothetical protein
MKSLQTAVCAFLVVTCFCFANCNKNNNVTTPSPIVDTGCGCNSNSQAAYVTYNNFLGYQYNGYLEYLPNATIPGWYATVGIVNSNDGAICQICNPDLPAIRAFTDTSSKNYPIPMQFEGPIQNLCKTDSASFGLYTSPETIFFYITIVSLKKR